MIDYMQGVRDTLVRAGLIRGSGPSFLAAFAIGAGVGLVAGATAAVLLTPSTGPDMRRELGWRAKQLAERTQAAVATAKDKLISAKDEATAELEERFTPDEAPMG